jgi:D-glycero-beta-D-manno-heptose-7-phosphate kinase
MKELFQQFNDLNILIIGDVMIDTYLWGSVDRISPEAPVPIVLVAKKENRLGGAANVALNIQALGGKPVICAIIGEDKEGDEFLSLLNEQGLSDHGIIRDSKRPTTVKTRVIGHKQQILRFDSETNKNISKSTSELLVSRIRKILSEQKIHAVIFQDYDKGVISPPVIKEIVGMVKDMNIITIVDPKKRNFLDYKGVTLFKPNLKELREGLKIDIDPNKPEELDRAIDKLKQHLDCELVMVTLSELGVYMHSVNDRKLIPAHIRNIADVSGAGDTVIATAALCLAAGLDEFKTAAIANLAGGLVCEQSGVVPVNKSQLLQEAENL